MVAECRASLQRRLNPNQEEAACESPPPPAAGGKGALADCTPVSTPTEVSPQNTVPSVLAYGPLLSHSGLFPHTCVTAIAAMLIMFVLSSASSTVPSVVAHILVENVLIY